MKKFWQVVPNSVYSISRHNLGYQDIPDVLWGDNLTTTFPRGGGKKMVTSMQVKDVRTLQELQAIQGNKSLSPLAVKLMKKRNII